ncbi:MAG: hypothetical protein V4502_01750 [Pseudomonadota bacterium]
MPIRADLRHFYRTPEWKSARAACRERAGDRCQRCGASNGTYYTRLVRHAAAMHEVYGSKRVLVQCGVAHLNHIAGDDRDENLKALCQWCHLNHDKLHHHETRAARKDAARPLLREASL